MMSIILLKQIVVMVCMVIIGVILGKKGIVQPDHSKVLSECLIYVFCPCALLGAFQSSFSMDKAEGLGVALCGAIVTIAVFAILGRSLRHSRFRISTGESACVIFSNAGNIVIPLVQGMLGVEYVIYTCPYIFVQSLVMWTYGLRLLGGERMPIRKMLAQPNIICIILGAVMFFADVRFPSFIEQGIGSLGNCVGPVSMIVIGLLLSELPFKSLLNDKQVLWVVGLRLIAFPLIAAVIAWIPSLVWHGADYQIILSILLFASLGPSASTVTGIALELDHPQTQLISKVNAVSVILCAITMPLQYTLFQLLLA